MYPSSQGPRQIRITSINIEGLQSNAEYARYLADNCDILCIQEHWLLNYECSIVGEIFPDHNCAVKSFDDRDPDLPMHRNRGRAGTAIVWKKELDHIVEYLPDGSDRVIAIIILAKENPLLLVNTYMPTMGSKDPEYGETLDEVNEILLKYWTHDPIWTGDVNADVLRDKSYHNDKLLTGFLAEHQMQISTLQSRMPTYHHFNGTSKSRIDVFIERIRKTNIIGVTNEERHILNTSSHDPITARLEIQTDEANKESSHQRETESCTPQPRVKWSDVDYNRYSELTESRLRILMKTMADTPIDIVAAQLNDVLTRCASDACPPSKAKRKKNKPRKSEWNPTLKPLVRRVKWLYYKTKHNTDPNPQGDIRSLKMAKKLLRSAQRQAAAKKRREAKTSIMVAAKSKDQRDFFKFIKKQRQTHVTTGAIEFEEHSVPGSQQNSWAKYFKHLASPAESDTFNDEYNTYLHTMHLLRLLRTDLRMTLAPVSRKNVKDYVDRLKSGKSPDLYGVAAEHLKLASPTILDVLCHICNSCIENGKIPSTFKLGILSPVLKKGKSHKDPNGYRRITITSVIGKILEKHMLQETDKILGTSQSHLQFGFTNGCSPMYAALVITEIMAEAKDSGKPLYLTFMDSSKAFDVVCHESMLNALHEQDVHGNLWSMYSSMYNGIKSRVKWDGLLSKPFDETQGIRQGGISSPALYKAERNKGLVQLDKNPTLSIGCLRVGSVMVADDLALTAKTATDMQTALLIAETDASRERYIYNATKTKTITINSPTDYIFKLNGSPIGTSTSEKHLGIYRNSQNTNLETIETRIKEARRTSYSLLGAGLCGLNGSGPEVALTLYSTYVLPQLLYGLDTLVLTTKETERLENYHRRNLRHILHLPPSTSSAAVYLLSGCAPAEALIHIRALTLFGSIASGANRSHPNNFILDLIKRQLAVKDATSSSWAAWIRRILHTYSLPSAYDILNYPPSKTKWKRMVKTAINQWWTEKLQEDAVGMSSLKFINIKALQIGRMHASLTGATSALTVIKITVSTKLMVRRYPLLGNPTTGRRQSQSCPLCKKEEEEDEKHFILLCPALRSTRLPYLDSLLSLFLDLQISIDPEDLVAYILDPSGHNLNFNINRLCRNMLFALHQRRTVLMAPEKDHLAISLAPHPH